MRVFACTPDLLPGLKPFVPGEAVPEGHVVAWGRYVLPKEDVRLANIFLGDGGEAPRHLFTPHANALRPGHPLFVPYTLLVLQRWRLRVPVIVRECRGQRPKPWTPQGLCKAIKADGAKRTTEVMLNVVGGSAKIDDIGVDQLQRLLQKPPTDRDRKLQARWPPEGARLYDFSGELWKDFLQLLPLPWVTAPSGALLNLFADMPTSKHFYDPDHFVIAATGTSTVPEYGSEPACVTRLHMDMNDAVDVMHFVGRSSGVGGATGPSGSGQAAADGQPPARCGNSLPKLPGYGGAGAVWDIWAPPDAEGLRRFMTKHEVDFRDLAEGGDPILFEEYYVGQRHREELQAMGVPCWHFEQYEHEAVLIPAGCPHQYRYLRNCIKSQYEFMTPESVGECLALAERYRSLPRDPEDESYDPEEDGTKEYSHVRLATLHMVAKCYRILHPEAAPPPPGQAQAGPGAAPAKPTSRRRASAGATGGPGPGPSGTQPGPKAKTERAGPKSAEAGRRKKRGSGASDEAKAAEPGSAQPNVSIAKRRRGSSAAAAALEGSPSAAEDGDVGVGSAGPSGVGAPGMPRPRGAAERGGAPCAGALGAAAPTSQAIPMQQGAAVPTCAAEEGAQLQPGKPHPAGPHDEAMDDEPPPPPQSPGSGLGPEGGAGEGDAEFLEPSAPPGVQPGQAAVAAEASAVAAGASAQVDEHAASAAQQGVPPQQQALQPAGAGQPPALMPVPMQVVAQEGLPQSLAVAAAAGPNPLWPAPSLSAAHLQGCALSRDAVPPPALQPGELRLCGLTVHPELAPGVRSAMEAWEAGLAEQLAAEGLDGGLADAAPEERQIEVLDPSALAGIEPCIVTADLSDLLGLSLDWGKDLPQAAPQLGPGSLAPGPDEGRGGAGLFAAAALRKGAVLGVLGGYVMPKAAARRFTGQGWKSLPSDAVAELAARSGQDNPWRAWKLLAGSLQMPVPVTRSREGAADTQGLPKSWELSMLGYGSLAALINDPRREPRGWVEGNDVEDEGGAAAAAANCAVVPMSVRGLTLPVVVAVRDIQPGEQLLRDYGVKWWRALKDPWCVVEDTGLAVSAIMHSRAALEALPVTERDG